MNALFAVSVAKQLNVSNEQIQAGLDTFVNVAHRMEVVAEIDGVEYINDSKATNVDATFYALEAMKRPVVWIVGGQDKGNDYEPLENLVSDKVKSIVFLGVDNTNLIDLYGQQKKWVEAKSAEEAVQKAKTMTEQGDVVLLSPACASFDLFKNYENRGDLFREAVLQLKGK
jgi:UDP-N-acetylmuramoylalanine--D-glutamate ligase